MTLVLAASPHRRFRLILAALGATILLLLGVAALAALTARSAEHSTRDGQGVLLAAQRLETLVGGMHTSARDYRQTGDERVLPSYAVARDSATAGFVALVQRLGAGDAERLERALRLQGHVATYTTQTMPRVLDGSTPLQQDDLAFGALRTEFGSFLGAERASVDARSARAARTASVSLAVAGVAALALLVVLVLLYRLIGRGVLSPMVADLSARNAELVAQRDASSRAAREVRELIDEQAALGRIATAVAAGAEPAEIFAMVAQEAGHILHADGASVLRLEEDELVVVGTSGGLRRHAVGVRVAAGPHSSAYEAVERQRTARRDLTHPDASDTGPRVATPVSLHGAPWGVVIAVNEPGHPLPEAAGERLARLGGLVELALSAAESRRHLIDQLDRLRELDGLKDEFISLVSHELRTPLTSIAGYLELLEDGVDSDEADHCLRVIRRNTERLRHLLDELLTLFRLDRGALDVTREPVDLALLARQAVDAMQPVAARGGVTLDSALPDHPVRIVGDGTRLAQVVDNLLSNAVKFTAPTGGSVVLHLVDGVERAVLTVRDTGVGVAEDERGRLFERFFRSRTATDLQIAGTGLGLAIAKAVTEAHGGTIDVESRDGQGTTFVVMLPLAQPVRAVA